MPGLRFLRAELPRRALPALSSACLRVVETGAAIALVAVDAADRDTCKLFEIGDDGAESVAIVRIARSVAGTSLGAGR